MNRRAFLRLALLTLGGCTIPPSLVFKPPPTPTPVPGTEVCSALPVTPPPYPASTPNADLYDATTGLHVKNYQIINIDPVSYRLKVTGLVDRPLELSLADLCSMPRITSKVVCTCRGYFEDVTTYTGVPLTYVMGLAGVQSTAKEVDLIGADGFPGFNTLEDVMQADNFLAYQWKGQPLPAQNGFPLRAVIPSKQGYTWTKYLTEIKVA